MGLKEKHLWECMRYQEIQKASGRILYIFSTKALLYTGGGVIIGIIFYLIFSALGMGVVGIIIIAVLGLIAYAIGTFKVPNIETFKITKKTGGEAIDDVIKRGIKFSMKKRKIYTYAKEERDNEYK